MWFKSKDTSSAPKESPSKPGKPDPGASAKSNPAMKGVNAYHRELTPEEVAKGKHRAYIGGDWDEVGLQQLEFLKTRGLLPSHKLCDAGCGALRAGLHFVNYLDTGNYHGFDILASLIDAGHQELQAAGLAPKNANLIVSDSFDMQPFGTKFDYILAASLFTHLFANHIVRCLVEARKVLAPGGQFFATFFQAPKSAYLETIKHPIKGAVTSYDRDPFHCSIEEMTLLGNLAGLKTTLIGNWGPRDQQMLLFTLPAAAD